jgi:hypothetical protein|nr:MAG TPA: hypothetical protein [Caudoviricetes sp.]
MATSFFGTKGCYYLIYKAGGSPYYQLNPSISGRGFFITRATTNGSDNIALNLCFNDIRVASATGKSFGRTVVEGIALLGPVTSPASSESIIQNYYNTNRFSQSGKPITLSTIGGGTHKFLLQNYAIQGVDDKFNILSFSLDGISLD